MSGRQELLQSLGFRSDARCKLCETPFVTDQDHEQMGVCYDCSLAVSNCLHASGHEPIFDADLTSFGEQRFQKAPIPELLRWKVFQRDGFKCLHCGAREMLRADHVIPESKGGATAIDNMQTLCAPCNSRKGARAQ